MTTHRPSELQCERTIIAAAKLAGWRVHGMRTAHTNDGRAVTPIKGDKGFPDLLLIKGHKLLAVELKRKPNKPTDQQREWIAALDNVLGVTAFVLMVPDDMDTFIREVLAA